MNQWEAVQYVTEDLKPLHTVTESTSAEQKDFVKTILEDSGITPDSGIQFLQSKVCSLAFFLLLFYNIFIFC